MKNLKSNIVCFLNLVMALLIYVFMSQSYLHIGTDTGSIIDRASTDITGYQMLGDANYFEGNSTQVMIAVSNLLVLIFVSLLVLISLYTMLCNFGVIKKSTKLANFINIALGLLTFVFALIAMFSIVSLVNDNEISSNLSSVGWASIVNFVVSIVLVVTTILAYFFSKQTKSKKRRK